MRLHLLKIIKTQKRLFSHVTSKTTNIVGEILETIYLLPLPNQVKYFS